MQLTITYDSPLSPNYEMEKELGKVLKKYSWEHVGGGFYFNTDPNDTEVGERDIEYRKEK